MIREKPIVRLRQVCKWHETTMVLKAVDLDITKGSFIGLLASDQRTESLLMRILGQQINYDFGLILLKDLQINRIRMEERKQLKHQIVLVNPYYPAPLETSVLDHVLDRHPIQSILFGRKANALEQASYHLNALGLTNLFDEQVNRLNSQDRMLVSVVKALMKKPDLLLLDALWFRLKDPQWMRLMAHLNQLVEREGLSVLVNRWDAQTLPYFHRMLGFDQGQLIEDAVVDKVDWQKMHRLEVQRSSQNSLWIKSFELQSPIL